MGPKINLRWYCGLVWTDHETQSVFSFKVERQKTGLCFPIRRGAVCSYHIHNHFLSGSDCFQSILHRKFPLFLWCVSLNSSDILLNWIVLAEATRYTSENNFYSVRNRMSSVILKLGVLLKKGSVHQKWIEKVGVQLIWSTIKSRVDSGLSQC